MIKEYEHEDIMEFLRESNAIEGVHDQDSLSHAAKAWYYLVGSKPLTEKVLLTTHKILMTNQCLKPNEKGYYRRVPVYIGGREGLDFTKINNAMKDCINTAIDISKIKKTKENREFLDNLIKAHHVDFEKIHPFVDGNGRTGRMLMNWIRMKIGLPILIIHSGNEQLDYYKWFKE